MMTELGFVLGGVVTGWIVHGLAIKKANVLLSESVKSLKTETDNLEKERDEIIEFAQLVQKSMETQAEGVSLYETGMIHLQLEDREYGIGCLTEATKLLEKANQQIRARKSYYEKRP